MSLLGTREGEGSAAAFRLTMLAIGVRARELYCRTIWRRCLIFCYTETRGCGTRGEDTLYCQARYLFMLSLRYHHAIYIDAAVSMGVRACAGGQDGYTALAIPNTTSYDTRRTDKDIMTRVCTNTDDTFIEVVSYSAKVIYIFPNRAWILLADWTAHE